MANSKEVIVGPQAGGFANKHVYAVKLTIDTYTADGIAVSMPKSLGKKVVPIIANVTGGMNASFEADGNIHIYKAGAEVTILATPVKITVVFIGQ